MKIIVLGLMVVGAALAQQLDLSSLDKLAAHARESNKVTLDQDKLKLVTQLTEETARDTQTQEALSGLKAVLVRSFEFDKAGAWSSSDLDPIRQQLKAPGWSKIVETKDKDEITEIYLFSGKAGQLEAMAVIAAERDELTVVNIVGSNIGALSKLSGKLGIPNISSDLIGGGGGRSPRAPQKPKLPSPAAPQEEE